MRKSTRLIKSALSFCLVSFLVLFTTRCLQNDTQEIDALNLDLDSSLVHFNKVKITLLDSNQKEIQVLYNDTLKNLKDVSQLRLTTDYRGKTRIQIEGFKNDILVYQEIRGFDLGKQTLLNSKVVFNPANKISRPP